MTISTYDDLVSTLGDWLNRADLAASIPTFIQLAEATMNADERFRCSGLMVRSQANIATQFCIVPPDFLEMVNLRFLVNSKPVNGAPTVEYLPLNELDKRRMRYAVPAQPQFFSVAGKQFEFLPTPDTAYTAEMLYHGKIPPLSPANETNWMIANHPNLYLYGALLQSAPYLKDDGRVSVWAQFYSAGADTLKVSTERAQLGAAPLRMRSRSFG